MHGTEADRTAQAEPVKFRVWLRTTNHGTASKSGYMDITAASRREAIDLALAKMREDKKSNWTWTADKVDEL